MRIETITPPATEPILLDEFKDHLRLDGSDEDAALGAIVTTARGLVEGHLDLAMVDRSVVLYLDTWRGSVDQPSRDCWWAGTTDGAVTFLSDTSNTVPLPLRQ